MRTWIPTLALALCALLALVAVGRSRTGTPVTGGTPYDRGVRKHVLDQLQAGQRIFRFDTFGDEEFWGGALRLHEAIAGEAHGGSGPGLAPRDALALGLKVDVDALPAKLQKGL